MNRAIKKVTTNYGLEKKEQQHGSGLRTRLEVLRNTLRPTPHVPLAMKGMNLFAKLEYVNPVGSIKDRAAYWILKRAAERGEICEDTTVIESSSGNFAVALAAFTHLVGLRFIPVIDPNISAAYESFLRRICTTVVKVEERDDTGGFLKTRLQKVKRLCAAIPNAYWPNQYDNPDAMEAHYELTCSWAKCLCSTSMRRWAMVRSSATALRCTAANRCRPANDGTDLRHAAQKRTT